MDSNERNLRSDRFLDGVGRQALRIARTAPIAVAKSAVDLALGRGRAALSFDHLGDGRYHVYLLFALTRNGAVGCPARDVHRPWAWLPLHDFIGRVRVNWRTPSHGVLLSQAATPRRSGRGATRFIKINLQYYTTALADHRLFAPYFAHPNFYRTGLHELVRGMRGRERNIRVFFAGTVSGSAYSEKFTFPILRRDQILNNVIDKFGWAVETEFRESTPGRIILLSTGDTRDVIDKHRLQLSEYMKVMSSSDFFICPPGWRMPHSHNLIEAMSVGTIPITNYHSYMRPALTPEKDCLGFSTIEELDQAIDRALGMPASAIQRLRKGVISYYRQHLEPESFGQMLLDCPPAITELVMNDESGR